MTEHIFFIDEWLIDIIRFGYIEEERSNIELHVFSHPYYYIATEDEVIGMMYKDFTNAFMCFEINNN